MWRALVFATLIVLTAWTLFGYMIGTACGATPPHAAQDAARSVVFNRMLAVSFSPEFLNTTSDGDGRDLHCRRVTRDRYHCRYRFTLTGDGIVQYVEHGSIHVRRRSAYVIHRRATRAYRITPPHTSHGRNTSP